MMNFPEWRENNDPGPSLIDIFSACIYLFLCVFIDPRSTSLNKWIAQAVEGRRVERVAKHADEREERGWKTLFSAPLFIARCPRH